MTISGVPRPWYNLGLCWSLETDGRVRGVGRWTNVKQGDGAGSRYGAALGGGLEEAIACRSFASRLTATVSRFAIRDCATAALLWLPSRNQLSQRCSNPSLLKPHRR